MGKKTIVLTDSLFALKDGRICPEGADIERKAVQGGDAQLKFGLVKDGRYVIQGKEFLDHIRGADALIIFRAEITPEIVDAVKHSCQVVGRMGVGFDNLNVPLLKANGIFGFNIPDYCVDEVATSTAAMLLSLERGIPEQNAFIKTGKFDPYFGPLPRRTRTLTLGIVGAGCIGKAVAQKLAPFYGRIIGFDPYVHADHMAGYGIEKVESLQELARASDAVTLHSVLSKPGESERPTVGMINKEFFSNMRKDAYLVNCARGAIIDMKDLYEALKDRKIAGAGLDVFKPENPNADPIGAKLVQLPNVLAVCHRAWLSRESERSQRQRVIEGVLEVLTTGKAPRFGHLTEGLGPRFARAELSA